MSDAATEQTTELAPAVAHNANTADLGRAPDITKAWDAVVAAHGAPDENAPLVAADVKSAPEATDGDTVDATPDDEGTDDAEAVEAKPAARAKAKKDEEPKAEAFTPTERRQFIQERIKLREKATRRDAEFAQQKQSWEQQFQNNAAALNPLIKAAQAAEAGDFDGIAKGIGEYLKNAEIGDWNTLNSEALKAMQTPVYKRMRQLERQQTEEAEQRAAGQRQWQEQQAQQARQHEVSTWKSNLREELESDEDPAVVAVFEKRPQLVDAVFNIQQQHFDATGEAPSAREAAVELFRAVREDYSFWHDIFDTHSESEIIASLGSRAPKAKARVTGSQKAAISERQTGKKLSRGPAHAVEMTATQPKAAAKAPTNISHTQTAGASAMARPSDADLLKIAARNLAQEWERA